MALVTIQRSPSVNSHDSLDGNGDNKRQCFDSKGHPLRRRSLSESYFAVKGAALVLPQNECSHSCHRINSHGGDIQFHLQSMFYLLRPDDTLKMAVKLESMYPGRTRYLVVVSCTERQDTEESIIIGMDCKDQATIGLVLPILADTKITLDGDGGFSVSTNGRHHIFKPVSVQAMWSALQSLHKAVELARYYNYFPGGFTHFWSDLYEQKISSDRSCLSEWHAMEDIESRRPFSPSSLRERPCERESAEITIRGKLREIMTQVDLDEVTSKVIRTRVEEELNMDLSEYKSFIDQEMIVILGQMDSATEIFDYLYLGSEWNASNLEELRTNGVGYILNVTREIDNFYPGLFTYLNIRVYDEEGVELLKHWDATYRFIAKAKEEGSKVLVHCRMGISRSASVVIAYAMKAYSWSLEVALRHVKEKRSCVNPNPSFMKQLEVYQGILDASKQRHNLLWRSKSENDLKHRRHSDCSEIGDPIDSSPEYSLHDYSYLDIPPSVRPKSWSPDEATVKRLFPEEFSEDVISSREQSIKESPSETISEEKQTNNFLFGLSEMKERPNQLSFLKNEPVSFQIGEADIPSPSPPPYLVISGVTEAESSDWTESVDSNLQTMSLESKTSNKFDNPRVRKVSSVKDRINELEHSKQIELSTSKKSIPESMHPESRGLVLNLATQFEGKASTPSPVEEQSVLAALSQSVETKSSPSRTIAIPNLSKSEILSSRSLEECSIRKPPIPPLSSSVPSSGDLESSGDRLEQYMKEAIPWNAGTVKRQKKDYEEKVKQTSGESPELIRRNSEGSLGSPVHSSNEEIFDSTDSKQKVLAHRQKKESSNRKVQTLEPCRKSQPIQTPQIKCCEHPKYKKLLFECPISAVELEEIPIPGTVRRAKQQLESRRIKRTNSFDGGLVYKNGNLIPIDKALRPIHRSLSWRTETLFSRNVDETPECQTSNQRDQTFASSGSGGSSGRRKNSGMSEPLLPWCSFSGTTKDEKPLWVSKQDSFSSPSKTPQPQSYVLSRKLSLNLKSGNNTLDILNASPVPGDKRLAKDPPCKPESELTVSSRGKQGSLVKQITKGIESTTGVKENLPKSPDGKQPAIPYITSILDEKTVRSLVGKFEDGRIGRLRSGSVAETFHIKKDERMNWERRNSFDERKIRFDWAKRQESSMNPIVRTAPPLPPSKHFRNGARSVFKLLKKFSMPDCHAKTFSKKEGVNTNTVGIAQGSWGKKTDQSSPELLTNQISEIQKKVRKLHGKSHPLSQLEGKQRTPNPLYHTM